MSGASEVTVELVEQVYERSMLGIRGHVELSHMEERLHMVLGPELDTLALDLLTEAAMTGSLSGEDACELARPVFDEEWAAPLREVLEILEHDGYLKQRGGVYSFESTLLRDWWRARFGFAYVPRAKRKK